MTSRRTRAVAVALAAVAVAAATTGANAWHRARVVHLPLDAVAVAVTATGERVELGGPGSGVPALGPAATVSTADGRTLVPATRALDAAAAAAQRRWLAAGTVPLQSGPAATPARAATVRTALLDLHALTLPGGAALAGWSAPWRYVWPRDAAFTAAALARTGHLADAEAVLAFLQRVQPADGTFQARYLPDGSGVPDDRGIELDGTGWALWAVDQVAAQVPEPADRAALVRRLGGLVDRSAEAARRLVADDGLPPASLDYWEVPEDAVTLGTAAPLLAGLEAAARLRDLTGDRAGAAASAEAADRLAAAIRDRFGPAGYARHPGSGRGELDAAVTFLLPPFTRSPSRLDAPGVSAAWTAAQEAMLRPAGGLAPGEGWSDRAVSWTPETALFALTAAASGRSARALHWLDWLAAHRTSAGSLPEKVLADGSPAAVAPLAWTAASVVLTAAALDGA